MDQQRIDNYLEKSEPLFGFNILGRDNGHAFDENIHEMMVYAHQLTCYERLFGLIQSMGAESIVDWQLPKLISYKNYYQNNVPVLSHANLDQFKIWLDELPKLNAESIIDIITTELVRIGIITDKKYYSGLDQQRSEGIEIAKAHFRFVALGSILQVDQSEFQSSISQSKHLIMKHKLRSNEQLIRGLRETVAALDLRTIETENKFSKFGVGEVSIKNLIGEETRKQATKILDENRLTLSKDLASEGSKTIENVKKLATSIEDRFSSDLETIENNINNTKGQIDQIVDNVEKKTKTAIESVASGFTTEGVLKAAFEDWEEKESKHRKAFYIGITIFFVFVLIIAGNAYNHFDHAFNFLNQIFSNTNGTIADAVSRIVVITIPIGTVIWVLRAILRWANLNLALAEDAAQRSVMAKTYVNLLKNGDVTEDKDDRKVMLEAIFRALPGIQEMDTAPPSIINFANPSSGK